MSGCDCLVAIRARGAVALGLFALVAALVLPGRSANAELPSPVLNTVFPAGGRAGATVTVSIDGAALDDLAALRFADSRITSTKKDGAQFDITIPADVLPGRYDLRAVGRYGISGPRTFSIGRLAEALEIEPNDLLERAQPASLDCVVNGRIDKPGDIDCFAFVARSGQRVVLELWSERIDSKLRAVVEVFDARGRRLAVNRGHAPTMDPLVDFVAPADGSYVVKVSDQAHAGSDAHLYRLDIDTGPRPEFMVPALVAAGKTSRVTLFGRNLVARGSESAELGGTAFGGRLPHRVDPLALDAVEIELAPPARPTKIRTPLLPAQIAFPAYAVDVPQGHAPVLAGVSDVPLERDSGRNHSAVDAQPLEAPCEVAGQLIGGDERDWYVFSARKGEVLWLEGLGARLGAPVDLDLVVFDAGQQELLRLSDCHENLGGTRFPTQHSDPAGRFVAPADGRYFVMLRNLVGGLDDDPRRVYRLSLRREEPDFQLAAIPRRSDQSTGFNVWRGGREMLELVAFRQRGMNEPICVHIDNLPPGVHCPDVWLGPGAQRAPLVVSADFESPPFLGALELTARARLGGVETIRQVRGGALVWPGEPIGWGRITDEIPLALGPESSLLVSAAPWEAKVFDYGTPRVFQNSSIDLAIDVVRRDESAAAPIRLKGVGLPAGMEYQTATIPADGTRGWISFSVPAALPPGPYTFGVQAETELGSGKEQVAAVAFSNSITVEVEAERIRPAVDPLAPRKIARGKAIKIPIKIERRNGFIGKILGELIAPGGITGLQARGVAFESQLDAAEIQVVAADAAPLGQHALLRLELVGMWEDRAVCRGTRFIELEITE